MRVTFTSGSFCNGLAVVGTGCAVMFPEQKWIGGLIILAGFMVLVFDVKVERGQVEVGTPKSFGKRWHAMGLQLLILLGAILIFGGLGWQLTRSSQPKKNAMTATSHHAAAPKDAMLITGTMQFDFDYAKGSTVLGRTWKNNLAHSKIKLFNNSDKPYEDFVATITPELPIAFMLYNSDLADCKLSPNYPGLEKTNDLIVMSAKVYCGRFPAHSSIILDVVTTPDNLGPDFVMKKSSAIRKLPSFVNVISTFNYEGEPQTIERHLTFRPIKPPADSVSVTSTHIEQGNVEDGGPVAIFGLVEKK